MNQDRIRTSKQRALLAGTCGGVLVLTLTLAYAQVEATRRLGPPIELANTPLIVRPPAGWLQDDEVPGLFYRVAPGVDGEPYAITRLLIRYRRAPVQQPLASLHAEADYGASVRLHSPRPASIAGLPGEQLIKSRQFFYVRGGTRYTAVGQSILRQASTARGDAISVEYDPLGEITAGDVELFDRVCNAIVVDGLNELDPQEALSSIGLRFDAGGVGRFFGADVEGAPVCYWQVEESERPSFSVMFMRSFLAGDTTLRELVANIAANESVVDGRVEYVSSTRDDGARIVEARNLDAAATGAVVPGVWAIEQDDRHVLLLVPMATSGAPERAIQVAEHVTRTIQFDTPFPSEPLETYALRGESHVERMRSRGLEAWWGKQVSEKVFLGQEQGHPARALRRRRPALPDGSMYEVRSVLEVEGKGEVVTRHVVRMDLSAYRATAELATVVATDRRSMGQRSIEVADRFDATQGHVLRERIAGRDRVGFQLSVTDGFVPPAVEVLAQAAVAFDRAAALWEVVPLYGPSTAQHLVLPLEANENGEARVLVLVDYWPRGRIRTFDANGELVAEESALGWLRQR